MSLTALPPPLPPPARTYYSISQLRTFFGCSYRYHLKYTQGHREQMGSAVFLGHVIHRMLQRAYYGVPLVEAHRWAWQRACAPFFQELHNWYALDEAYRKSGSAHTKSRQHWSEQHPEHAELARLIEGYRDDFLGEYTWGKTVQLTAYYRWSCSLLQFPREHLLLPDPILVEGQGGRSEEIRRKALMQEEDQYTLLHGVLPNGIPVAGVPDVFTIDREGVAHVADYKVMPAVLLSPQRLAEDGQLALYVALLRQAGYIQPGQKTAIGHIYLTERQGIQPVWSESSPSALLRLMQQFAYIDRHVKAQDFLAVRGVMAGKSSPCLSCGLAYTCPTYTEDETGEEGESWDV